jgi:hypothetical protein
MRFFCCPPPSFAVAVALLLGCSGPGDLDDDDASPDDDDFECGDASDGSGGPEGLTWLVVDGFGTPEDPVPDYEIAVYLPPGLDPGAPLPLLMITARRMPDSRPANEGILFGPPPSLGLDALADDQGWLVALPLPGLAGDGLNWTDSVLDQDYWNAAVDLLEASYNVDRDRIWMAGSSAGGAATVYLGWQHAHRIAAIADHAGSNPFGANWPAVPWADDCAGIFISDVNDPIVPQSAVEQAAAMFEDAGQVTERVFDYPSGHEWNVEQMNAIFVDFFPRTCNRTE